MVTSGSRRGDRRALNNPTSLCGYRGTYGIFVRVDLAFLTPAPQQYWHEAADAVCCSAIGAIAETYSNGRGVPRAKPQVVTFKRNIINAPPQSVSNSNVVVEALLRVDDT